MGSASRQASREARESAPTETDRALVWAVFKRCGELTADEAAEELGWTDNPYRARRRVSELKASGKLEETGEMRKTESGRNAAVLRPAGPPRVTQLEMC